MTLQYLVRSAWRGLTTNWGRSLLTITGIIIGVGAIVLVMSLGEGAQQLILSQVQGVGGDTIVVRPGREPEGPNDFADTILSDSLTQADAQALAKPSNVTHVSLIAPAVLVAGSVSFRDEVYRPTIIGWTAEAIPAIFKLEAASGTLFSDDDIRARAKVAVIGEKVRDELFGSNDPIGELIRIKQTTFRVIGVLPSTGQLSLFNPDELIVVPYSTAQQYLLGIDYFHEILIKIDDSQAVHQVADEIRATLRERHGITDPSKDDFFVTTQQDIVERISTITQILTIFLTAIAAISLVVGGVGIMNIMLVSVTERTPEIGLRKAVGATNRDIRLQFLFEALLLTMSGGAIGTFGAVSLTWLITQVASRQFGLDWPLTLPLPAIILGLSMATLVGLTFGLYPAINAARKSPIEALRYE